MVGDIAHRAEDNASQALAAASNIKWNVLFTAVGTLGVVVAVLIGLWALTLQIPDVVRQPRSQTSPRPLSMSALADNAETLDTAGSVQVRPL